MKTCPECRAGNPDEAMFCGSCGLPLSGSAASVEASEADQLSRKGASVVTSGNRKVSLPLQLVVIGVVGLMAVVCLLIMIVVGMVGDLTSETTVVVLSIVHSLVDLYAFLLALMGGYVLISKVDLSRLFSPVKAWVQFLLLVAVTGLLYLPILFIFERLFTFVSRGTHIAYSLERLAEAGLLVVILAGAFWLLMRRKEQV